MRMLQWNKNAFHKNIGWLKNSSRDTQLDIGDDGSGSMQNERPVSNAS